MKTNNPLAEDLDHILAHTDGMWEELKGQRIFITGGTGFFGCWLLESFAWANDRLALGAAAVVLTRDAAAFAQKAPHLAHHPAIGFHRGDVRSFDFPHGEFSHIIHAATEGDPALMAADPLSAFDINVLGTRRVLEFAQRCRARKLLFTSSGAVYGKQAPEVDRVTEDYRGGPDPTDVRSTYGVPGEEKRIAETLCALYAMQCGVNAKVARCFSFIGPYLPLHSKFAAGNFIRDALSGGPIMVLGDGTAFRSYLYGADLAIWLWTILVRGSACRPYNVGSEKAITIADLAHMVARAVEPTPAVVVAGQKVAGARPERYLPSTRRAEAEFGLVQRIGLHDAIRRTIAWHSVLAKPESRAGRART